ncbi:MAG: RHS repeat protein, partial [candidate division Zixibacteria bacterium]|nr:RHS repeat protein [candidate division Zixibacteria bacterium]
MTGELDSEMEVIGQWAYDSWDRILLAEGAQGTDRMAFQYDYLRTLVTDGRGNTKTFHNQLKDYIYLAKEIEGEGCATCSLNQSFNYDENLNLIETIDGRGTVTLYEYDAQGNPTVKTEASGTPQERRTFYTYTYDTQNPLLVRERIETTKSVSSPDQNKTTTLIYDGAGTLLSKEETGYILVGGVPTQKTYITQYGYNSLGQLVQIDGPRTDVSDVTILEYYDNSSSDGNSRGQLKAIVNALGHRTEFSDYDANGNVGRITDPNGVATTYIYDQRNRIKTITNQTTGALTQYFYDSHGNLATVILPEGNQIDYTYDTADRLTDIRDSLGNTIHHEYDSEGNRTREEINDPQGVLKKFLDFEYDPSNRLKKIINPDSTFTEFDYDPNGNRIATKDPNGHTTTYTYDELNRLFQMTQPGEVVTSYGYDIDDNLTSVTDGNASKTDYTYDDFGRLAETISPDTGTTTYGYDESANLVQKTNAQGTLVSYTYDALNRLTAIRFSDSSQDITYSYDSASSSYGFARLTGMNDPSGISTYHYDAQGNLIKEEKQIAGLLYTTQYSYDKNNLLRFITYPSGRTVTYELDEAGRVTQVHTTLNGQPKTLASSIRYLPYGGIRELTYGNSLSLTRAYDLRYQISSIQTGSLINLAYTQDPNGNITEIENQTDPNRTQAFGYDTIDRLVSATGIYGSISYGYDAVGNRLNLTVDGG